MEKIFTVTPGGDPGVIALKVSGVDKLTVNEKGELELVTSLGIVKLTTPVAYQIIDGQRVAVDIAYEVNGDSYGFKVGDYNYAYPLVIDPLLASTYLGGSGTEYIYSSIALDAGGNVFVTGVTNSTNFPTVAGGFSQTRSGTDAYVAKLSADFSQLLAGTFFGGSSNDYGYAITVAGSGNAYITGYTNSTNFPSTATSNSGGYDMFAAKLDGDHLNRIAATCFGGSGADYAYGIALDSSGNVIAAGYSASTISGMTGYQKTLSGSQDGIVVKFSADLSQVLGSTYLGGSGNEQYNAVVVDQGGNAYVGGYTNSADYPTTTGALQTNNFKPGNNQGCVSELSSDLSQLEASTYLGGTSGTNTIVRAIALDNGGNIYVTGETADTTSLSPQEPFSWAWPAPTTAL
ncbi:MAG: Beta-propeller repeat protein [Pelotomaculum sp. PtaB.Bin104]|nr:MAG: Beta-propeller repeat protein [Pelotomaculum sp. PtaB.Bin104]